MLHKLGLLMALPIAAFAFSGCGQFVTGGGWLQGHDGGKATFGFVFNNTDDQGLFQGTYHDPSADVMVRFDGGSPNYDFAAHHYVVNVNWVEQGKRQCTDNDKAAACTGTGVLYAVDNGEPGVSEDDYISITLFGFHGGTYSNSGTIGGGNIQDHATDGA